VYASLLYTSIRAGVVVPVPFQEIDGTPDAKTCAQGDDQGLQYTDGRIKKCHVISPLCGCVVMVMD